MRRTPPRVAWWPQEDLLLIASDVDHRYVNELEGHPGAVALNPGNAETPDAAAVERMARELYTLLRNGKEFPYADGEEKRYYELVVTRWLEKLPKSEMIPVPTVDLSQKIKASSWPQPTAPVPDTATVLAGLREEMAALADEWEALPDSADAVAGIRTALGLVRAAQQRLMQERAEALLHAGSPGGRLMVRGDAAQQRLADRGQGGGSDG